jgi:hypothetical protein
VSTLPSFFLVNAPDGSAGYGAGKSGPPKAPITNPTPPPSEDTPFSFHTAPKKLKHFWKEHWPDLPFDAQANILMDEVATFSCTSMPFANEIALLLSQLPGLTPLGQATITDATACAGGDTIAFARHFSRVNAIELSPSRCQMLLNNVDVVRGVLGETGLPGWVYVYQGDCLAIAPRLRQDVLYLDVPWGGKEYKKQSLVRLFLSSQAIYDVVVRFLGLCKFVALKVPPNADCDDIRGDDRIEVVVDQEVGPFRLLVVRGARRVDEEGDPKVAKLLLALIKSPQFVDTLKSTAVKR